MQELRAILLLLLLWCGWQWCKQVCTSSHVALIKKTNWDGITDNWLRIWELLMANKLKDMTHNAIYLFSLWRRLSLNPEMKWRHSDKNWHNSFNRIIVDWLCAPWFMCKCFTLVPHCLNQTVQTCPCALILLQQKGESSFWILTLTEDIFFFYCH